MGGRLYLLSLIEVVICQDKLIRTEDVASRHNDEQQHGPNDADLQITTPIGPCVVDCNGKSQTTRSSDPLHDVHCELSIKPLHQNHSEAIHRSDCFLFAFYLRWTHFQFQFIGIVQDRRFTLRCCFPRSTRLHINGNVHFLHFNFTFHGGNGCLRRAEKQRNSSILFSPTSAHPALLQTW